MKSIAVLACLLVYCYSTTGQSLQQKAIVLKRVIEKNHYSPRPVDDKFSVFVFNDLINTLDTRRLFLTAAEYNQLLPFKTKLDDELNGKGWSFFNLLSGIYKKALNRADSIINTVSQKPFNFSTEESILASSDSSFNFSENNAELSRRWNLYLKLMTEMHVYYSVHSDSSKTIVAKELLAKKEPVMRNKVKRIENRSIDKILNYSGGIDKYLSDLYLNTIASAFDPHSNYFSTEGREEFTSAVSSESYSFGIELDENQQGGFIIDHLQPGGPAWKSGEMNKGDEVLEIQRAGKEPFILSGESAEDVYQLLYGTEQESFSFKIRKNNNVEKLVTLRKEKIENEENIVRSFILTADKKIGYILLPGFYTEWENETGSSCAGDVAKEIIKLRKENIEGLILDVRYNGGGSIQEALDMAGIFIDEGPLTVEKEKSGKVFFLKDPNRGTIYNGPLILLVNGQSASASEMLAASLQDYNRAVIVGGNTFGKATVQQIFAMDTITNLPAAEIKGSDALKITVAKFYRLDGRSAQLNGVKPDVLLPDEFDALKATEKYISNALSSDTVRKNNYYKPLPALPVAELAEKSAQRIKSDKHFQTFANAISLQQTDRKISSERIPLKWELFEKWMERKKTAIADPEPATGLSVFKAENNAETKKQLAEDPDSKEWNDVLLKNISSDIFLQEAYRIISDLILLQKKN